MEQNCLGCQLWLLKYQRDYNSHSYWNHLPIHFDNLLIRLSFLKNSIAEIEKKTKKIYHFSTRYKQYLQFFILSKFQTKYFLDKI